MGTASGGIEAVCAGIGVGLLAPRRGWRVVRTLAAACLVALVLIETRPFDFNAPMLLEAQWDSGNSAARRQVTRYLEAHYDGRVILASMGSLAHYMQELSRAGFDLKDFVHEGNGPFWAAAMDSPRGQVGWILIEEWAEGGDQLARAFNAMTQDLATGRARLAQAERVAAWREVARRLAHEIKNPLTPIAMSVETLRDAQASVAAFVDERNGITAGYAGAAQIAIEAKHPGTQAMFIIGCGADQNPLPRRTVALCEKYGHMLADVSGEEVETYLLSNRLVEPNDRTLEAPSNECCGR